MTRTQDHRMYVAGDWTPGASARRLEATSPATGEPIGTVPEGTREDARRAILAANDAWPAWAARSAFERAAAMDRVADLIEERRDHLAYTLTLDQGKPLHAEAYDEVDELVVYFRMAAADATRLDGSMPPSVDATKRVFLHRVPRGVVGVITPWNWPYTMPAELLAPALASGNAVVWSPASSTSICAVGLAECIADAELPPGVFNMITGPGSEVGDEIAASPGTQAIGFVGSTATGRRVAERAAGKATLLEMGGNGPMVILEDADLDAAAEATLASAFLCAGQSCTAGERFLVHERVYDGFLARLEAAIGRGLRLGDPFSPETTMGPLNNETTASKMDRHVADALDRGAELLRGGSRAGGFPTRLYYEPTVLGGVTEEMEVAREETFGPIVPVTAIRDEAEALRTINSSPYGLLTAVWTGDLARGLRFAESVRTGWVNVNASSNHWESHLPFGGRAGSRSGIGRVGGRYPMETFTELKTVILSLR
ncbi:aldehyde dehydrogenase family protein [Rubrobacter marinus]|uniref:Aldehyde dehydrogenase family protein n=1 Tax=Rubrobacter marinus TaxID=2653852 RepID=A0A6G8Q2Q0_9ACTN|nr:aldehyde dehydrogenase family protein [Rubrobacter marinus]